MNFYKLKGKHKKWFIINKIAVFGALAIMLIIALATTNIQLPTQVSKLSASIGFVMVTFVFMMAILNRIGSLFKIKSVGFVVFFFLFLGLEYIVEPVRITTGLVMIPLLIDDIIFYPIWLNIWYKHYDNKVRIEL